MSNFPKLIDILNANSQKKFQQSFFADVLKCIQKGKRHSITKIILGKKKVVELIVLDYKFYNKL